MKLITLSLVLLTGCTYMRTTTESQVDPYGKPITKTTVRAYTIFDAQGALTKLQVRGETVGTWAAGTSIGTLNQSASSTNMNAIIGAAVKGMVEGMK